MRAGTIAFLALTLVACAGRTAWDGEYDDAGFPIFQELTLSPGESGQVTLTLQAEGSHSGFYEIRVESGNPAVATATVAPTSGQVDDDNPLEVVVTIAAAADAPRGESATIVVTGTRDDGAHEAGDSVRVRIPM